MENLVMAAKMVRSINLTKLQKIMSTIGKSDRQYLFVCIKKGCSTPRRVEALNDLNIAHIACGSRHTAVVTSSGKLYTWGDKENGVAGHGDTEGHQYTPKLLEKLSDENVVQISACGFHTGCITKDGEVLTRGEGKFGRLGHNNERNCHSPKLVETLIGKKPKQVACGGFHSSVITEDGKMYTFGGGEHGQLGHSDKVNKVVPTFVKTLEGTFISQITCDGHIPLHLHHVDMFIPLVMEITGN